MVVILYGFKLKKSESSANSIWTLLNWSSQKQFHENSEIAEKT